jgi:ubiquinone/menaquinone biosynthesis C-methylase UbiE
MLENGSPVSARTLRVATEQCYREYNARKGAGRNSLLHNPEVLFQTLARDAALVRAMRWIKPDADSARVLDVGCGEGDSLWLLLRLGFEPLNLSGVDIQEEKIIQAKATNPLVNFECADATSLGFRDETFDMAMESMMFLQLTDDDVARRIASEMIRVTKPGGMLLVSDWRYSKPGSKEFKGVSRNRIAELYQVGKQTRVRRTFRGALIPPVGRFLSKHLPSAYFAVHKLMPFLTGQVVTVLEKCGASKESVR